MDFLEEARNLSPEEKKEFLRILQESEPKEEPRVIDLGHTDGPRMLGPSGEELSPERYYDYTHPLGHRNYDYFETLQVIGKPTQYKRFRKEEIDEYNQKAKEDWIRDKREYASKHGYTDWTDEYIRPAEPKYHWEHPRRH